MCRHQYAIRLTSIKHSKTAVVLHHSRSLYSLEATTGFEPVMEVLQTSALPLGYVAGVCPRECLYIVPQRLEQGKERGMIHVAKAYKTCHAIRILA